MEDCDIEIISSTIVDIKFFTSFQIVFIFKGGNRREDDKQGGKERGIKETTCGG